MSTPPNPNPDPAQLGPYFLIARARSQDADRDDLARRYGQEGRRAPDALDAEVIQGRLEAMVFMVLSVRRSLASSARALSWFPGGRVELILGQIEQVARTSVELAYHLCTQAPEVLRHIPDVDVHDWVIELLEVYDRSGTQGGIRTMQAVAGYAEGLARNRGCQRLDQTRVVLDSFVAGLAGRRLKLAEGEAAYTDTETLFVPESLAWLPVREGNFRLYKALIAHLWAQTWFGTWRGPFLQRLAGYQDPGRALALFHALETLRLDACLARELPGLAREMRALAPMDAPAGNWALAAAALALTTADATSSWRLVADLYAAGAVPPQPLCYQGEMHPTKVAQAMMARVERERTALAEVLAAIADEQGGNLSAPQGSPPAFGLEEHPDDEWPGGMAFQLVLGDQPIQPRVEAVQLMHSIVQDFGHIPPEYLEAAGQGVYHRRSGAAGTEGGPPPVADAQVYDEWDYTRQSYRKGWCQLRERDVHPESDGFVGQTRHKYRGLLKHLYRTFEALRGEERLVKREPYGEDPDIDAIVEAYADTIRGLEPSAGLFQRRQRLERNVAVLFMVDMSGSTKGWINEVQRESLVLLCESLELLGDRYAIYGFSGYTHMRCELFRVKGFDEPYAEPVHDRISGIRPQDYTRMGVVVRHLSRKLLTVDARTRVLIVLSDGRPDDEDGYRGDYGIEDTRQAVLEARSLGVHPFCITIDDAAQGYLPHIFGPAGYTLVENVAKLPYRVSDIYRRITA
jgi:nitric oxide reductase NorD protein